MFNAPSDWTLDDWHKSRARCVLYVMPFDRIEWIDFENMSETEKEKHPEAKITGGFLKKIKGADRNEWWKNLSEEDKNEVLSLPNFDADIFKEITGIDVRLK